MPTRNPSYDNVDGWGRPAFEVLDDYTMSVLLAGATPKLSDPMSVLLADSLTLAIYSVVGLDSSGKLTLATWDANPASAIKPIGVLARSATSGASNTTVKGQVYFTGCFNIDEKSPLVWHSSFDTEEKKRAAFIGSPSPCQIVTRRRLGAGA